jgi:hypothetical protein
MSRPESTQEVGITVGCPPPKNKAVTLANWQDPPYNHCQFQRIKGGDDQPRFFKRFF